MPPETKKLGTLLLEAGLISNAQLEMALQNQKARGGRLGSTLVAHGILNEESLMAFLSQQLGVPRVDLNNLQIAENVLQRIPRRLAEQAHILPIAFKEPRTLVLAMVDPMDLSAVDSARFASGMNVEPVVASYSSLRQAIRDHYARIVPKLQGIGPGAGAPGAPSEGLAVPLEPLGRLTPGPVSVPIQPQQRGEALEVRPETLRSGKQGASGTGAHELPPVIHQRSAMAEHPRTLESYGSRALVLSLVKLLQRRGILGQQELERFMAHLVETGDTDPDI